MTSEYSEELKIKYELNKADFWKENGDDFFNQQEYDKAIKCYNESISIEAINPDAWNKKGISLLKLGKVEEALFCRCQLNSVFPANSSQEQVVRHQETSITSHIESTFNTAKSNSKMPFNPGAVKDYKISNVSGGDIPSGRISSGRVLTQEERKQKALEDGYRNS